MTALPHIAYFLGANAPTGFYSLYSELLPPEEAPEEDNGGIAEL